MPTNIKIIHTRDFIRAKPDGTLDFTASSQLLKDLATEVETSANYQVLVDTRGADVRLSTFEIYELGVALAGEPGVARGRRLAILVPPEDEVDAHFFEDVSVNRGADLRAFTDFETAITWLIMKGGL